MLSRYLILVVLSCCFLPSKGFSEVCTDDCVAVGEWQISIGLGLGWRTNPLHEGDDSPMFVLPEVSYYGERFFLENLDLGWTLYESRQHQFNLLFTPGTDQMFFNPWDPYNFLDPGGASGPRTVSAPQSANLSYQPSAVGEPSNINPPPTEGGDQLSETIDFGEVSQLWINSEPVPLTRSEQLQPEDDGLVLGELQEGDQVTIVRQGDPNRTQEHYRVVEGRLELRTDEDIPNLAQNQASLSAESSVSIEEVKKRKMAGLAGIEYFFSSRHFEFHTQLLTDVTGIHGGYEARVATIFPWESWRSQWAVTLGANYKSEEILDYYYGVDADDTDAGQILFEPAKAGASTMLRLDWQKPLGDHWSLRAIVQYTHLPNPIIDSPLVSNSSYSMVFFGGVYHF